MSIFIIIPTIILLAVSVTLAHGEDKPGPHGGHIRMPGNFHTELVADQNGVYRVYLLDMQFKNPIVINSDVETYIQKGKKKINLKCSVAGAEFFLCKTARPLKSGELVINAKRDGVSASLGAQYKLPLKYFKKDDPENATETMDHSKHK